MRCLLAGAPRAGEDQRGSRSAKPLHDSHIPSGDLVRCRLGAHSVGPDAEVVEVRLELSDMGGKRSSSVQRTGEATDVDGVGGGRRVRRGTRARRRVREVVHRVSSLVISWLLPGTDVRPGLGSSAHGRIVQGADVRYIELLAGAGSVASVGGNRAFFAIAARSALRSDRVPDGASGFA